jgi:hypothetical protein
MTSRPAPYAPAECGADKALSAGRRVPLPLDCAPLPRSMTRPQLSRPFKGPHASWVRWGAGHMRPSCPLAAQCAAAARSAGLSHTRTRSAPAPDSDRPGAGDSNAWAQHLPCYVRGDSSSVAQTCVHDSLPRVSTQEFKCLSALSQHAPTARSRSVRPCMCVGSRPISVILKGAPAAAPGPLQNPHAQSHA